MRVKICKIKSTNRHHLSLQVFVNFKKYEMYSPYDKFWMVEGDKTGLHKLTIGIYFAYWGINIVFYKKLS